MPKKRKRRTTRTGKKRRLAIRCRHDHRQAVSRTAILRRRKNRRDANANSKRRTQETCSPMPGEGFVTSAGS